MMSTPLLKSPQLSSNIEPVKTPAIWHLPTFIISHHTDPTIFMLPTHQVLYYLARWAGVVAVVVVVVMFCSLCWEHPLWIFAGLATFYSSDLR